MRKFVLFAVLYAVCLGGVISCSKNDSFTEVKAEPADEFVGTYVCSVEGADYIGGVFQNTIVEAGRLIFRKKGSTSVSIEGLWETTGSVVDSELQLQKCYSYVNGSVLYVFGPVVRINDRTIKFTYHGEGYLEYNGNKLDYHGEGNVEAVKQ